MQTVNTQSNKESELVSIIVPVYNVEKYIEECLKSIMSQDADISMECIIVDDCGTDNSMNIVRRMIAENDSKIDFKIINQSGNQGVSAARNAGISVAKGVYILFVDSDDVISCDCVRLLYQEVEKYPNVDIVVGGVKTFPDSSKDSYFDILKFNKFQYVNDCTVLKSFYLKLYCTVWNKLIRRNYILSNNLYFIHSVKTHDDIYWHWKSYFCISSIAFVFNATYMYRRRSNSLTSGDNSLKYNADMEKIIENFLSGEFHLDVRMRWEVARVFLTCKYWSIEAKNRNVLMIVKRINTKIRLSDKFPPLDKLLFRFLNVTPSRAKLDCLVTAIFYNVEMLIRVK